MTHLVGPNRTELTCLLEGFWDVIPKGLVQNSRLNAQELEMLVVGVPGLDVDEWQHFSSCQGTRAAEISGWLFAWLHAQSQERRATLLAFATGSSRLPIGGWSAITLPRFQHKFLISIEGDISALPSAHTCFNILVLPPVNSSRQLQEKLELALQYTGHTMHLA